ncbi:QORL2 protein, partial [Chauna torquata]|nr:QORL2 protein [Chauna torquata]
LGCGGPVLLRFRISALALASQSGDRGCRTAPCTELAKPLLLRDLPAPPLQPHQELNVCPLLLRVYVGIHFCGLIFADILACRGLYQDRHTPPFTPGTEPLGSVMETGENVSAVKEGNRVISVTGSKAVAAECVVDEKVRTEHLFSQITEEFHLSVQGFSPTFPLFILPLPPRETVLVMAGAWATGLAIIDLAVNMFQAKVTTAAGSDPKHELALTSGSSHRVNYNQGSLREEVKALTGDRGVNVAIGGDIFKAALQSLAWEGRIVVMGFARGKIPSIPTNLLLLKNVSAMGVYWGQYQQEDFPLFSSTISSALQYCQEKKIHPHIGAVFKLEEVDEAFNHVLQRKSTGKVIISMK